MRSFLAFDTATDHLAIGVGDLDHHGMVIAATDLPAPRAANTVLLAAVERVLAEAGLEPGELAGVACGRGPGSFTGVRIGVATAKGFAHGAGLPLVGFGTLDAVAWRVWRSGGLKGRSFIGVVGDAMRGEVYPALFRVDADGVHRLGPDRVTLPGEAVREWTPHGGELVLAGNALRKHSAVFEGGSQEGMLVADEHLWSPDGGSLIDAAWAASGPSTVREIVALECSTAYRTAHPGTLLPVYTRLSDAEEAERRKQVERPGADVPPSNGVAGPGGGVTCS